MNETLDQRHRERRKTLGGVSELGSLEPFWMAAEDLRTLFFSAPPDFFISHSLSLSLRLCLCVCLCFFFFFFFLIGCVCVFISVYVFVLWTI